MPLSRSLHTDPYRLRAARRADRHRNGVPIRVCPARPGFVHPAGAGDVARVLECFGAVATYGLRRVELRQRPANAAGPVVGALRVPGVVLLFEQPAPPWVLAWRLAEDAAERLGRAGALVTSAGAVTRVDWPGTTLRDFVLFDGLMHEVGHHAVQHAANKHRTAAMRTADHERRADAFAMRARAVWAAHC